MSKIKEQNKIEYHYPVKVVCGKPPSRGEHSGVVADGRYFTAVNICNPSNNEPVTFRRKVSIALPGAQAGPVSGFLEAHLRPCEALEIDCPDIFRQAEQKTSFIKGFLNIESPQELDIVAVYTAADKCCEKLVALHTERVPARRISAFPCKPLDMTLNTGTADWRAIQRPGSNQSLNIPVDLVPGTPGSKPGAWKDISGADWVSSGAYAVGEYRFRLCFDLCKGFKNAKLIVNVRTDNAGKILLNGSTVGTTNAVSYQQGATKLEISDQGAFKVAENCLEVVVTNTGGPVGFTLAGAMTAQ